jgi:hypothetical protein
MKRRQFLQTSIAASVSALATVPLLGAGTRPPGPQEYYELRAYRMKAGASGDALHQYLEKAYLPALNRAGIKPVGVFVEIKPQETTAVYLLAPYKSLDQIPEVSRRIERDADYRQAAAAYLDTPAKSAPFERIDSWFLLAFAGMPRMGIPAFSRDRGPDRLFELRTYEGPTEAKAQKKVDMFNDGEIDVMHEVGLSPIFYGQAISGPNLPHLTYMTSGENEAAHQAHWAAFGKHPTWERMKNDPQYKDTVSKITKWMLKPTGYSQI